MASLVVLLRALLLATIAFTLFGCGTAGQGQSTATPTAAVPGNGGNVTTGRRIFVSAGCSRCHMLAAGSAARGAGLSLRPSYALAIDRVTNGKNGMPSFKSALSVQEIRDVAAYVVASEPMGLIRVR